MLVQVSAITSAGESMGAQGATDAVTKTWWGKGAIERAVTAREIALLHALKSNIWPSVSLSSCLLGQGTFGL